MYVSAHGCVADSVLEVLCFYKPGFVLVLLFKEILGKRGRRSIFFVTSIQSGWGGDFSAHLIHTTLIYIYGTACLVWPRRVAFL